MRMRGKAVRLFPDCADTPRSRVLCWLSRTGSFFFSDVCLIFFRLIRNHTAFNRSFGSSKVLMTQQAKQ
jgi:hypothetical protein